MKKMFVIGLVLMGALVMGVSYTHAQQQTPPAQTSGWYCPWMGQGNAAAQGGWTCPRVQAASDGGWICPRYGRRGMGPGMGGRGMGGRGCRMGYRWNQPAVQN